MSGESVEAVEHEIRKTGTAEYVQECEYSPVHGRVFESGPCNMIEHVDGPGVKCLCGKELEGMQEARRHIEEERGLR